MNEYYKIAFIGLIFWLVVTGVIFIQENHEKNHPCLETKTYCYTTESYITGTNDVYINCENTKHIYPGDLHKVEKCLRRG